MPERDGQHGEREQLARALARDDRAAATARRARRPRSSPPRTRPPCRGRGAIAERTRPTDALAAPSCRRRGSARSSAAARARATARRSSTMSQPTAIRPCGVSSSLRSVSARSRTTVLAIESARPSTSPPPMPQPSADPSRCPSSAATIVWTMAPGIAIDRTASRSRIENWMPTPNISRMTPSSASSRAMSVSAIEPGVNGPIDDAGHDVADDRGQPQAPRDQAADERGGQADGDGRDENGLVVHGSSRSTGGCAGLARVRARTTAGGAP